MKPKTIAIGCLSALVFVLLVVATTQQMEIARLRAEVARQKENQQFAEAEGGAKKRLAEVGGHGSADVDGVKELRAERDLLAKKDSELQRDLARSKQALNRAKAHIALMQDFASYIVKGSGFELPKAGAETSIFAGEVHRQAADFSDKWGDKIPDANSPEYAAYLEEREDLAKNLADLTKAFASMGFPDSIMSDPGKCAASQSLQISGSLQLNPESASQLNALLTRTYGEAAQSGFKEANRPPGDSSAWDAQRKAFARQVYDEAIRNLPPDKRQDFDRLYGQDFFALHTPDKYPIFLAEVDHAVAGWCSLSPYRPGRMALPFTAEISDYIDRAFHRQGVATRLIHHAIAECPMLQIKTLFGILLERNIASRQIKSHPIPADFRSGRSAHYLRYMWISPHYFVGRA